MTVKPYWIEGPWRGRLAIVPRPRGGDWLGDEVRAWRTTGLDVVVSALTLEEIAEWQLQAEPDLCETSGIQLRSFPILDRGTPESRESLIQLINELELLLDDGKNVAVHCRAGIGRSSLMAGCLLVSAGVTADAALQRITQARGVPVPDTPEQATWLRLFASSLHAAAR